MTDVDLDAPDASDSDFKIRHSGPVEIKGDILLILDLVHDVAS